jgi:cell division protein FtsQ
VKAASRAPKGRARIQASRRGGSARAPLERPAPGKRKKFRTDPLSRLLRAIGYALDPRRPVFKVGASLAVVAAVTFLIAAGYIHRASASVDHAVSTIAADAGFDVSAIRLSGTRYAPPSEILDALGFGPGQSIFDVDPRRARENLRKLNWIADARISRQFPDVVLVHVVERTPFALWQNQQGLYAVDRDGNAIAPVDPARFRKLPFFVGDAPAGASELVGAIRAHRAVAARTRAMQRVEGRRWNLIFDDGVVVKLPEDDWQREIAALEQLIVEKGVLERDISEIDLRDHDHYIFVVRNASPPKNSRGEPT